ncbi:MAG: tetratricopeptide repeat protein [Pseudomonadota bacterium]
MSMGFELTRIGRSAAPGIVSASVLLAAACPSSALAFDQQSSTGASGGGATLGITSARPEEPKASIQMRLRFGLQAYKRGKKDEAFEAYRDAADQGHSGAQWKLAHMYAAGDGVAENDYEAFKLFEQIVTEGAAPGSRDSAFVANALVSLAGYFNSGIPGTPVQANPERARDLYWQAATTFGEPHAQFELGRMFLASGDSLNNTRQAAKWFNQASEKGHAGAQAMLGHLHFKHGRRVVGLSMLTAALQTAAPHDRDWIRTLQEEAFAVADEAERRTAIVRAEELLAQR